MGKRTTFFTLFLLLVTFAAVGQECSHLWKPELAINPSGPKDMSGDAYAAYGLAGFKKKKHLKLVIEGEFFRGRFMSFESYRTGQKLAVDQLYDFQMHAEAGSENPFHIGVPMNTPNRDYRVEVLLEGETPTLKNVLYLSKNTHTHSLFYRAYAPHDGKDLPKSALPKIYALDSRTGLPTACPKAIDTEYDPGPITLILKFVKEKKRLEFKEGSFWNGTNHAVPAYVNAMTRLKPGKVVVVKFKAPTFTQTGGSSPFVDDGEVRYWSFCYQYLKESLTMGCVPDFLSQPDPNGFVTIVIGPKGVRKEAERRGYSFLEERRGEKQKVTGYFLRDIFPKQDFTPYEGDYLPQGVVCEPEEFLDNGCIEQLED